MAIPLPAYDDSIATNTNNAVRAKAKRLWTAKIELQRLIKTIERAGRAFLVAIVEYTWILLLEEEANLYNKFPLSAFFTRLKGSSSSLEPPTSSPSSRHPSAGGPRTHASPNT